jgi:TolB-like protein
MKHNPFNKLQACKVLSVLLAIFSFVWLPVAHADFQRTKIAVLDFELIGDKMETAGMGAILSEWFTTGIVKSGLFDVVERAMLQKIISEQKLSSTGMIDESSAATLGKILGVKVIITGSVLKLRDTIEINSRVISVESGSIIAAENMRSNSGSDLHALVDDMIVKILRNFPLTGYVVKKDPKTAIIDLGLDSGLNSGTEFIVYKEGEVIKHPKTGEVLDVEQIVTGRLRISKVSKNVAVGDIISEEPGGIQYGQMVKSVQKDTAKNQEKPVAKIAPIVKETTTATEQPKPPEEPKQDKALTEKKKAATQPSQPLALGTSSVAKDSSGLVKQDKPAAKEVQPVKDAAQVSSQPKPQDEPRQEKVKTEKKKAIQQPTLPPISVETSEPPQPSPPPTPPLIVPGTKNNAAIFPFELIGDAHPYSGTLAERIYSRIDESSGLALTKSYYRLKGISGLGDVKGTDLYTGSSLNLPLVKKKGSELGFNLAILGRMDIRCKDSSVGSNNCDIRKMEVIIVNLATGKIYAHDASKGIRSTPEDAMDEACKTVFKKVMVDMK